MDKYKLIILLMLTVCGGGVMETIHFFFLHKRVDNSHDNC